MIEGRIAGREPGFVAPCDLNIEAVAHQHHDVVLVPQVRVLGRRKLAIPHAWPRLSLTFEPSAFFARRLPHGDSRARAARY